MSIQSQAPASPSLPELLHTFQELLPAKVIRELIRDSGKRFYVRIFAPLVLLWCLLYQRLHSDHTCDAVVSYVKSGEIDHLDGRLHQEPLSVRLKSESTASFCKGRKRLPLSVLEGALRFTAQAVQQGMGEAGLWHGHPVALLDGSTYLLRPEPELVEHYGRHSNGQGETYWVVPRVVGGFCLCTGALLGIAEGPQTTSEQQLAKEVIAWLPPGCVCVGDGNFGVFSVVQAIRHDDAWALVRMSKQRARKLAGRKLCPGTDIAVRWAPSPYDQLDATMSADPVPGRLIYVHLERNGFRPVDLYLFTTLQDAEQYPLQALLELYGQRWHVELDLRYVKDTLKLDLLPGKSVDVTRKELLAGLVAYNLIRGFMAQAAQRANRSPLTLSFTKCWRRVQEFLLKKRPHAKDIPTMIDRLLNRLAKCKLPKRKRFRIEPRAIRRRPRPYPVLKGSREEARKRLREQLQQPAAS
jgi:hypothetical protein